MTTSDEFDPMHTPEHIEKIKKNMDNVEALSQRLIEVMAQKKTHNAALDLSLIHI